MSIVLDGVVLSGSLQWTDRHSFSPVAQSARRTLGGGLVVFSAALTEGRPITLEATEDTGWITYAMLCALEQRAAVAGGVFLLTIHGESFTVMFRHEDSPALEFSPLQPKAIPEQSDSYIGTLKFITV